MMRVCLLACAVLLVGCQDPQTVPSSCCTVIAHAGGGIDGNPYTNSEEALLANYAIGRRVFEVDFDRTADGVWVAAHDWGLWKSLASSYGGDVPPPLAAFLETPLEPRQGDWTIPGRYRAMSFDMVERFLRERPDATVVTDTKTDVEGLIRRVLRSDVLEQFVLQAYTFQEIDRIVDEAPDAKIILTLYKIGLPDDLVASIRERRDDLQGITLPMNWAARQEVREPLLSLGLPLYVHGSPARINSAQLQADLEAKGLSGFYLD